MCTCNCIIYHSICCLTVCSDLSSLAVSLYNNLVDELVSFRRDGFHKKGDTLQLVGMNIEYV